MNGLKFFLLHCYALICAGALLAQSYADSLHYHGDFEREAFVDFQAHRADAVLPLRLLLASDSNATAADLLKAQSQIGAMSAHLGARYKQGKYKTYAKKLFEHLHQQTLRRYAENVVFIDLFENGRYNCATATALLALIAAQNGVPFEIREQPTHVFIVIDPDLERIALESTNPVSGIYKFDLDTYVKMLVKMKYVDAGEVHGRSAREVYESYLDGREKGISLVELAGDLYHNMSLTYAENEDFEGAFKMIQKALLLNNSERSQLLRNYYLYWLSTEPEFGESVCKGYVNAYLRYHKRPDATADHILSRHDDYASKMLIANGNPGDYLATYQLLKKAFAQEGFEASQRKLGLSHHIRMAESYELKRNFDLVLTHLDTTLQIEPDNIRLQNLTAEVCAQMLSKMTATPQQMMARHADYLARYPFIADAEPLRLMQAVATSLMAAEDFQNNNAKAGMSKHKAFIQHFENLENTPYLQDMTGYLYGQVSAYYLRQRDDAAAKKWLQDGLKLAPQSQELRRRMENYEEYELRYKR